MLLFKYWTAQEKPNSKQACMLLVYPTKPKQYMQMVLLGIEVATDHGHWQARYGNPHRPLGQL